MREATNKEEVMTSHVRSRRYKIRCIRNRRLVHFVAYWRVRWATGVDRCESIRVSKFIDHEICGRMRRLGWIGGFTKKKLVLCLFLIHGGQ